MKWRETIHIGDVWKNEEMTLAERRDAIVARIKASHWYKDRDQEGFDDLGMFVEDLALAETVEDFDEIWSAIYDEADYARVWIDRTKPREVAS
jgi:hypothetical protein